jgi:hypothetical protein
LTGYCEPPPDTPIRASTGDKPGESDYYVGVPHKTLLQGFEGFTPVEESELPKAGGRLARRARQRRAVRPGNNFADRAAESSVIAEHLLARFGELEPFDFGRSPATYDALGALGDESDAHQPPQLVGREAMHKHDRFGAAFGTAAREQHDSAALMGLEDSTAGPRHGAIT